MKTIFKNNVITFSSEGEFIFKKIKNDYTYYVSMTFYPNQQKYYEIVGSFYNDRYYVY